MKRTCLLLIVSLLLIIGVVNAEEKDIIRWNLGMDIATLRIGTRLKIYSGKTNFTNTITNTVMFLQSVHSFIL